MFSWEHVSSSNARVLDGELGVVIDSATNFVILEDITLQQLTKYYNDFRKELYEILFRIMAMTPSELVKWDGRDNYNFSPEICPPDSCVAFKRASVGNRKLAWLDQKLIVKASIDLGLIPALTPHKKIRSSMLRREGSTADFAQSLPRRKQTELLRQIFFANNYDLDEFLTILIQSNAFALADIRKCLDNNNDVNAAWTALCDGYSRFHSRQAGDRGRPNGTGKGQGRRFGIPWFLAYLAREQILLWPINATIDSEFLLPRFLKPLLKEFFVPKRGRALAEDLYGLKTDPKEIPYILVAFRDLLLGSNFFADPTSLNGNHLLHFKHRYELLGRGHGHRSHGINLIFRSALKHYNLDYEDRSELAAYFGGRRKASTDHGREAFGWVDHPSMYKLKSYRELVGTPPDKFPDFLFAWSADLRSILTMMDVQHIHQKIRWLNYWLYFLVKIGERAAPKSWRGISRAKHINSGDGSEQNTFVSFLVENLSHHAAEACLITFRQAWSLAATRDGFTSQIPCPVDLDIDVRWRRPGANPSNLGRTRRKALEEGILHILIEENRRADKDGNMFAFARSLNRYDRDVVDSVDGRKKSVFWPAHPILLDMILNTGMRKVSAQWMDSSEGDRVWIDITKEIEFPNPLKTALPERQMGFVRLLPIGPNERVLGMHLPVNKTGQYEVPWIDKDTARLYTIMRDWQIRYYPRKGMVLASRDALQKQYAAETAIPAVYPVFRDPVSKADAYPPSDASIHRYWNDLLTHCEAIVNENRRQISARTGKKFVHEPFFRSDGKPRWDIHSLRVTTVTTLIEAGVSPQIVALLVGHKSVAMTWHYVEVNNRRTSERIRQGLEDRRRRAIAQLRQLEPTPDWSEKLSDALGGIVTANGMSELGIKLLYDSVKSKDPAAYEVFSHGICPGGDCSAGRTDNRGSIQSVFRPRACSRCRYRVTGPAFLNGLVHRLNALMIEISDSLQSEAELNSQIETAEDNGNSTFVLEGLVRRQREFRDEILAEWAAELNTIKMAEALLDKGNTDASLPLFSALDDQNLKAQFESVHQLSLLHQVVSDAKVISGASIEIPPGTMEKRDALLLEIAKQNNATSFFYSLNKDARNRALSAFGDLLMGHATIQEGDAKIDFLQSLIDGSYTMDRISELAEKVCKAELGQTSQFPKIEE